MTYRSTLPAVDRFSRLRALVESMRLHQWSKNLLVFVPAVLSDRFGEVGVLYSTSLTFLSLSIVASATYLINDLVDAPNDRRHWSKSHRPVASGRLPASDALTAALLGLLLGFYLGMLAGPKVMVVLGVYVSLSLAYSGGLKRVPIFDAFTLAPLFTLRLSRCDRAKRRTRGGPRWDRHLAGNGAAWFGDVVLESG